MNQHVKSERQILLIEDSETQALLFQSMLEDAGMSVHRVASAEAGIEYLQSHRPSLAVVDFHLPGMQGNEFCRIVRDNAMTDAMPLLVLTDDSHADAERYLLDWGADDYVAKSKDVDFLLARIDLLLRRSNRGNAIDESMFYKAQRVLVVDDSPTYLAFLEEELSRDGYRMFTASSGADAIAQARRSHIDCAVIDLIMPEMDGLELCRQLVKLRKPGRSLPVLIVTAQGSKERMMESLEVGADDYVEKSGDPTVLKARLRALMRRKMLQDEHQRIQDEIREKELELVRERTHGEAHLRAILDNAADGIITIGPDAAIQTFNPAAERMFGYTAEEVTGQPANLLLPQSGAVRHDGGIGPQSPLTIGQGPREVDARRRDGSLFPVEFSLGEVKTDDTHFYIGVVRDITDRRAAEAAIRDAEEQMHLLMDSVGEGVFGVDTEGRTTFLNRSAGQMLGHAEAGVIGRRLHEVAESVFFDLGAASEPEWLVTARTGEVREGIEHTFRRADGTELPVRLSSRPLRKDGALVGAVVSFQDLSHSKDLEARLRQSQKMEAIGRLTGGVAHDFNNLLTVIMGNLQLLARTLKEDDPALARIGKIMAASKSGAELTRRLLTFSRQQVLETSGVDINEMVREMEELLHRTLGEEISLRTALCSECCKGRTDRNQLEHALLNLCVNARDAMPNGGQLTIETRRTVLDEAYAATRNELKPGDYIEIAVSDTGTGIPPEIIDKIFEPFFTTKDKNKGTGLGLASVFGFMKQSGGHVNVYSEVGHGSTFKLFVPAAPPESTGDTDRDVANGAGAGKRPATILVVEDEAGVRDVAVSILTGAGHTVIEAASGPAGLKAIAEHPEIELVFSDVIMPGGMTGPDMAEKIREQRPGIPVLFASGYAEHALADREERIRDAKFIAKPYDAEEVSDRIAALLEPARP